ncbi:DNA-binding protein [Chromobacterium paludis]|nr:DNA-binding protein [Chromobacterium paludis]
MASDIYARIRQVAFELVGEGAWPTVAEVRARLGSGSNTTINNVLKEWRQDFLSRMATSSRRPDWPASLAESFEQVWQKACDEAELQLDAVRQEIEAEAAALRDERAQLLLQQEQAAAELQSLRHELELRAARQLELNGELEQARRQLETAQRERQELQAALARQQQELAQARREAETQQAEAAEKHAQQLREARDESERKEALAYERLEGLRVRLYQQVEDERKDMKQQLHKLETSLQQARQDAAKVEGLWRERVLERERENGGLQARLDILQQQAEEARAQISHMRQSEEAARLEWRQATEVLARLQERQALLPGQWLERACAALLTEEMPREPEAARAWLRARLEA